MFICYLLKFYFFMSDFIMTNTLKNQNIILFKVFWCCYTVFYSCLFY